MWLTPSGKIINIGDPYTSEIDGTNYCANSNKAEISELTLVTEAAKPTTTQFQDATFTIVNAAQVWTVTNWTQDQIDAYNKSLVPHSVTMRQARLALLGAGLLANVNAAVAAMSGVPGQQAQIAWEFARDVFRTDPLIAAMSAALSLTEAQIDTLFIQANTL